MVSVALQGEYFAFVGATLSFIAASIMLAVLVADSAARKQVRSRLLLVLAALDALAGLLNMLAQLPIPDSPSIQKPFFAINQLALGLTYSSFTWTCVLAVHVYVVLVTGLERNGEDEKKWERRYWLFLFISMFCVNLPLIMIFSYAVHFGPDGLKGVTDTNLIYLVLQYACVLTVTVRIHYAGVASAGGASYRRQVTLFLVVFLLLTGFLMMASIIGDDGYLSYPYFYAYPARFYYFVGLANALVWGLSRWCMVRLVDLLAGTGFGTGSGSKNGMEMPLLAGGEMPLDDSRSQNWERGRTPIEKLVARAEIPSVQVHVEQQIGSGGFGSVFRGTYLGNIVAVKEVSLGAQSSIGASSNSVGTTAAGMSVGDHTRGAMEKVLSEAAILAELRHPNIVTFYGLVLIPKDTSHMTPLQAKHTAELKGFYFVQEMCETALNKSDIGVGLIPGSDIYQMLVQIATGMQYLHSKGVMHRDLKPGNVLVKRPLPVNDGSIAGEFAADQPTRSGEGTVYKLCDFGLARLETSGEARERSMTGKIGTSLYMAPEMLADDKVQLERNPFAADVFSYGILAWQVLAGVRPYVLDPAFAGMNMHQLKHKVLEGHRPGIPSNEGWPLPMGPLLRSCWAQKVEDRPTFKSVVRGIEALRREFSKLDVDDE